MEISFVDTVFAISQVDSLPISNAMCLVVNMWITNCPRGSENNFFKLNPGYSGVLPTDLFTCTDTSPVSRTNKFL